MTLNGFVTFGLTAAKPDGRKVREDEEKRTRQGFVQIDDDISVKVLSGDKGEEDLYILII